MAMKRKVTEIVDRYEFTFLAFHRNDSQFGRIYHRPTESSKRRFSRAVKALFEARRIGVLQSSNNESVYVYRVKHD